MENWQDAIVTKLNDYCGFALDVGDAYISVVCDNSESFEVSMFRSGSQYQVGFDGWHEHFDAEEDAVQCFAFGLSDECRLKVVKRGAMDCRWTLEYLEKGSWRTDTVTGLILIPFWRTAEIEYRYNAIKKRCRS